GGGRGPAQEGGLPTLHHAWLKSSVEPWESSFAERTCARGAPRSNWMPPLIGFVRSTPPDGTRQLNARALCAVAFRVIAPEGPGPLANLHASEKVTWPFAEAKTRKFFGGYPCLPYL